MSSTFSRSTTGDSLLSTRTLRNMTGVRRKKAQRKKRINTTKPGVKRKRKDKKVKVLK